METARLGGDVERDGLAMPGLHAIRVAHYPVGCLVAGNVPSCGARQVVLLDHPMRLDSVFACEGDVLTAYATGATGDGRPCESPLT